MIPLLHSSPIFQKPRDLFRPRQLPLKFFGQALDDAVSCYAYRFRRIIKGILDNGAVLSLAEDDADGGILPLLPHLAVERSQIELHLADKLRLELTHLELDGDQALQPSMEEQKVDEELAAVHLQPVLAPNKGEKAAHGAQELFDATHQRALQLTLGMLLPEFEKVKGVFILDGQLRLRTQLGRQGFVEIGLAEQGLLVALIIDLMDKHVLGPPELFRHADVELTFQRIATTLEND